MQPIIVKGHHVHVKATPPGETRTPASVRGADAPAVLLLREGGVVQAIEVRCACGRPTVVQLDYEHTPSVPTPPPSKEAE